MKELRIGLVLYGGVSLAVYMSGIITELYHLLRATRADPGRAPAEDRETGTRACYRTLIADLQARHGGEPLRVVVDAVAGTSAGGLGGAALAKAVVEGADPTVLNTTWVEDADIAQLKGTPARLPVTLLILLWSLKAVVLIDRIGRWFTQHMPATSAFVVKVWRGALGAGKRLILFIVRPFNRFALWVSRFLAGSGRVLAGPLRAIESLPGIGLSWLYRITYTALTTRDGRLTPLDGRHFTRMIARSFKNMSERRGPPLLPEDGTFELCLTCTDLYGWPRHLPVSPELHAGTLYESAHAHALEFRFRPYDPRPHGLDDFALTFASRSTAGFPGAFAPIAYDDIAADYRCARPGEEPTPMQQFARYHLREHQLAGFPVQSAWMVDGGVLDNKPFSYVAGAIENKPAGHEVHRSVIYIEPDPEPEPSEHIVPDPVTRIALPPTEPPTLRHLAGPMFSLIRHEPILEDLRELDRRNAKVRWLRRIRNSNRTSALAQLRKLVEKEGLSWPPEAGQLDRLRRLTNAAAASQDVSAYPGYVLIKARRAADGLADLVCRAHDYPYASRQGYLLRQLVRQWLTLRGALDDPAIDGDEEARRRRKRAGPAYRVGTAQRDLLGAFDLPFRLRRIRTLVQVINRGYDALPDDPEDAAQERSRIDAAKAALSEIAFGLESAFHEDGVLARARNALEGLDIDAMVQRPGFDKWSFIAETAAAHRAPFDAFYDDLVGRFRKTGKTQNREIVRALRELPPALCGDAAIEFGVFAFVDLALFPLMDMADIGDLITIDTMRISPADARFLSDDAKRLKGWRYGAFAGFLDRSYRQCDLLWGRLDGAERLIELLVTAAVPAEDRDETTEELRRACTARAMRAILDETPADDPQIAELIRELHAALDGTSAAETPTPAADQS